MAKAENFQVFTINIFWNYNKITIVVTKKHRYFSFNNPISSKLVPTSETYKKLGQCFFKYYNYRKNIL